MSPIAALMNLFVVIAGVLFAIMPELSRPGIFFGVTVNPDFRSSADGRKLLRAYWRSIALSLAVILAVSNLIPATDILIPLRVAAAGLAGIGCWIMASRRSRPYAQPHNSIRVASLTPETRTLPGGVLFLLGPYLILGIAAWFLYANWSAIPDIFPIHWDRNGMPNGFASRTVFGVFGLLIIGAATTTFTLVIACVIFFMTPNARTDISRAAYDISLRRATYFVILFVDYFISTLFAVMTTRVVWAADLRRSPTEFIPFIVGGILALGAGILIYLVRVSRLRTGTGDGTPDACWRWGAIYYNPDDPSLFVEKRLGIGWTLNFANKWAWLFLAFTLLPTVVVLVVVGFVK